MFPHAVDSTMIGTFRSCPTKFDRMYMRHWKPQNESVHLVAGGAFAKGVETARRAFYEGLAPRWVRGLPRSYDPDRIPPWVIAEYLPCVQGDTDIATGEGLDALLRHYGDFECPADSAKSLERTSGALAFYFERYPLGNDGTDPVIWSSTGRRAIEFSFAEPLPVLHPITNQPILYAGRCDAIVYHANGIYCVDEKTTSSLGASWPKQWELRSQFTGYQWAAQLAGLNVQGTLVRGVSILKTKYDTMQVPTYRSPVEIQRWLTQVTHDLERMKRCWEEGYWDYNLDHACSEYGGCSMVEVCKRNDPDEWLPVAFTQRVWDPLARKEMTVEEFETSWGHGAS